MNDAVILYTTWPDAETAQAAGVAAVEAKLAACANVLAPMTSIYRWQGALEQTAETPMLLKTTAAAADRLRDLIVARHPYETPCVVALTAREAGSNPAFVQWIGDEIA
jgi:periplasmic divalent cation tolerance protein